MNAKTIVLFLTVSLYAGVIGSQAAWRPTSMTSPAMGAVTILTVTKIADTNDGVCGADCSLREAINVATPGSEIRFGPLFDSPQTISLSSTININKSLTISGRGARNLTIKRSTAAGTPNFHVLFVGALSPETGNVAISGVTVENGSALGGIRAQSVTLTIRSSTIRSNTGPGIFNAAGDILLINSTVSGNNGGAIVHTAGGVLTCINSTISGNTAPAGSGFAAGIYTFDSNTVAIIINSTIANNTPSSSLASGIVVAQGSVHLRNTIVAGNQNNAVTPDVAGTFSSNGNNIIGNVGTATGINHPSDRKGTNPPLNPQIGTLQNNGGPTDTHALSPGSLAINTGNSCVSTATCAVNNPPLPLSTDQRGTGFPRQVGGVDVGAFESSVPCVYTLSQPSTLNVDARSSGGSFSVSTASGCPWTAVSSATWLVVNGLTSGFGNASIVFSYTGNATGSIRTASINVGGQLFTINQGTLAMTLSNVSQNEGNSGTAPFVFAVTLSAPWTETVTVNLATIIGNSTARSSDYTPTTGTLTFAPGQTVRNFLVPVHGDTLFEPNETFYVSMGPPSVGVQLNTNVLATILNDDVASTRRAPFDFDGDNKTDIGIFHPADATWWINRSSNSSTIAYQFGAATDKMAPADFTGDGKTDIAIFRPSNGEWIVLRSEDNSYYSFPFGTNGDIPAPADYDNDGKADPAVFRPSSGYWHINRSTGGVHSELFGVNGDVPVASDYDGDGKADIAIYRPSNGEWWLNRSTLGVRGGAFGTATDKPVPADFTGDGKTDIAFFRPSNGEWYVLRSEDFSYFSFPFGMNGDVPAPGDYDGDGKADPTIFRPSAGQWVVNRSSGGTTFTNFGATGDRPIASAFLP